MPDSIPDIERKELLPRILKSGMWSFSGRIVSRALLFIRVVVLARLLAPEDFGLMAIALMTLGFLRVFTEPGIDKAIVQFRELDRETIGTAWIVSIARGFILYVILWCIAPLVAAFFREEQAVSIIRIAALSLPIWGFQNITLILFRRNLQFGRFILFQQISTAFTMFITIGLAFWMRTVWALVYGEVVGTLFKTLLSFIIQRERPGLHISFSRLRALFDFGKHILGAGMVMYCVNILGEMVVGRVLGAVSLGFYHMAYKLGNLPVTQVTYVLSGVAFPAYARVQEDHDAVMRGYLRTLRMTLFGALPFGMGLLFFAPDVVPVVFGTKWNPIIVPLQIMVIAGIFRSIAATIGPVLIGIGRPDRLFVIMLWQLGILAVLLYPGVRLAGITGAAVALAINFLMSIVLHAWYLNKCVRKIPLEFYRIIGFLGWTSFVSVLFVYGVRKAVFAGVGFSSLCLLILTGGIVYLLLSLGLSPAMRGEIREILRVVFQRRKEE